MMRFELAPEHEPAHRRYADVDGVRHIRIDLATLEGLGHDVRGSITYPYPGPGWATTRVGSTRWAAWFGGAA